MKISFKTISLLVAFAVAMGFLETAVVIYLRQIYYPEGFHLPLKMIDPHLAIVEVLREAATLIMLITIAMLSGKSRIQRFAFFLLCFGIWDIFYYIFLKLFLHWPASLMDGDILFLIPVPWIVCACPLHPVINNDPRCSNAFEKESALHAFGIGWKNITLMIAGSCLIIFSFIMNYKEYVQTDYSNSSVSSSNIVDYNWWIFTAGELTILIPVLLMTKKQSQTS